MDFEMPTCTRRLMYSDQTHDVFMVSFSCFYIFVNPFISRVTDRYLPQQYIIM